MSNDATTPILSALEIAAFERRSDGSFASLGPVPEWARPYLAPDGFVRTLPERDPGDGFFAALLESAPVGM
jgi:hypothetical protein